MPRVSAILVGYLEEPLVTSAAIESLMAQTRPPDEVVLVDNSGDARHRPTAERTGAVYVDPGSNLGFAQGVNVGVSAASGDYLLLMNPDSEAEPAMLGTLVEALDANPLAAVAGAQVLLPDGRVNAGSNPIHLSGLSWSGGYLGPPESGPPREVLSVSGATMLVRTSAFERLGGFHPAIFMYHEDVDLCWRARLAGLAVLFCPEATVLHDYEFDGGPGKWQWLEEGRLIAVLSNFESRTLLLLSPLLLATEFATLAAASAGGWLGSKFRAWNTVWRKRRQIRLWRQKVAALREVPDRDLLPEFTEVVATPALDSAVVRLGSGPQIAWARVVRRLA